MKKYTGVNIMFFIFIYIYVSIQEIENKKKLIVECIVLYLNIIFKILLEIFLGLLNLLYMFLSIII